jgi:alkanesulfonate monooxygenase SsuD/methylene tetrahydromethanopterin reductase-like flavin-dependent oxidoreductase (luciferase family)
MKYGMFLMPNHPPGRNMYEAIQQDLQEIEWLDELGYEEAWCGEHLTAPWEPLPAGDLLIAQALARTSRIKVCSGGYIPTFYHPAALALRIAQLDHMAQGRYMLGIAAGSQPTDWALTGVDGMNGKHRDASYEAIEIMRKMWTEHVDREWKFEGEFWTVENILEMNGFEPHIRPFQQPHPPIAIAGLSPSSGSLAYAGREGFLPMSVFFNNEVLKSHWDVFNAAAEEVGKPANRADWRINRDVFVAETDEEARDYVLNSNQARVWTEQYLPAFKKFEWLGHVKHDQSVADEDVDLDYLVDNLWLVGSPDTVAEKLGALRDDIGDFGMILGTHYDWGTDEDAFAHGEIYHRHLDLFANEVMPQFQGEAAEVTSGPAE